MFFEDQRARLRDRFVFWGITVGTFAAMSFALNYAYMSYAREQRHQAESIAQEYANRLKRSVDDLGDIIQTLAVSVEVHARQVGYEGDVQAQINRLMEIYPQISGIQIAPKGLVALQTRIRTETESLLGVNLFENPKFKFDAQRSVNQARVAVVGPNNLHNGDLGFYVRVPVFQMGGNVNADFWGFVQASVRLDNLLKVSGFENLGRADTLFELWKEDEDTGERLFFYSSQADRIEEAISVDISVPDNHWTLIVEDPTAKRKNIMFALILIASCLGGAGAAWIVGIRQTRSKEIVELLERQKDRFRHLTALVNLYQTIYDAAEVGFVQWDKNQCLETWNLGFEKMYPKLAPYLDKGMTRKQLYALRVKLGETEVVTDWESTGTWYRQLADGRIIMLKRTAMPDGGRLGMHLDMTESLGDQDYENRAMLITVSVMSDMLRINAAGSFSLGEAKRTFLEILDAVVIHKPNTVLFDGRFVGGEPYLMERFYCGTFASEAFQKAAASISANPKLAFVFPD